MIFDGRKIVGILFVAPEVKKYRGGFGGYFEGFPSRIAVGAHYEERLLCLAYFFQNEGFLMLQIQFYGFLEHLVAFLGIVYFQKEIAYVDFFVVKLFYNGFGLEAVYFFDKVKISIV